MLILDEGKYLGNVLDLSPANGLTVGRVSYGNEGSYEIMHYHENPHISLVLMGGNIEKRRNTELERLPGCVTFYHSEESHQNIHKISRSRHINIEFDPFFLRQNLISEEQINRSVNIQPDIKFSMLKIYNELLISDHFSNTSIHLIVLEALASKKKVSPQKPGWILMIEQFLRERISDTVSLAELSAIAGVHPITISKHFSRYFNCTLAEYMRKLKIEKAIALMKTSECTLTNIAFECGFADQSHFVRTFKGLTGLLPSQYKKL